MLVEVYKQRSQITSVKFYAFKMNGFRTLDVGATYKIRWWINKDSESPTRKITIKDIKYRDDYDDLYSVIYTHGNSDTPFNRNINYIQNYISTLECISLAPKALCIWSQLRNALQLN